MFVLARMRGARHGWISDLYVSPTSGEAAPPAGWSRRGRGATRPGGGRDRARRAPVERRGPRGLRALGLPPEQAHAGDEGGDLEQRLSQDAPPPSDGLVFAQTDDEARVAKAVRAYVPRLGRSARTDVHPPANGWIAVDDELCSGDPSLLRRLAQELSYRTGGVVLTLGVEEEAVVRYVLFDRGSIADEYSSLPEYHGPLPPGDVVALSANPTVAQRLTGADPQRLRAVAKTASSAADLPPAEDLYSELAGVLESRCRDHALRRRPLPVLRPRAHRPRREVGAVRHRHRRSLRPAGLALREEPAREGAGARGGRPLHPGVGRDHGAARGALPRAAPYPADPAQRALARLAVWRFDDEFSRDYYAARRGDDGSGERFESRLANLDQRLTESLFLAGHEYTLADIAWFPWLPRAEAYLGLSLEDYPAIAAWRDRLAERPAVAAEIDVVASLTA